MNPFMSDMLEAQKIAFAPFAFQCARSMRDLGVLEAMGRAGAMGLSTAALCEATGLSEYAIESVCEAGLSFGLCTESDEGWAITRVGVLLYRDRLTRVNMDFTHDVCFKGLFHLSDALTEGRPAGLPELGTWSTIYEGLSKLPDDIRKSWLDFDHFYSDSAMGLALKHVLASNPRNLLDVGGNTGKFAIRATTAAEALQVTIADLPGQLGLARPNLEAAGVAERVSGHPVDVLDPDSLFPTDFDAVWMSQFLVCFSKVEIVSILERARQALAPGGRVWILDTYWDDTDNEVARYCLHGTSLYFTAMANGNSRMYSLADTEKCIQRAGLRIVETKKELGWAHTLVACEPA